MPLIRVLDRWYLVQCHQSTGQELLKLFKTAGIDVTTATGMPLHSPVHLFIPYSHLSICFNVYVWTSFSTRDHTTLLLSIVTPIGRLLRERMKGQRGHRLPLMTIFHFWDPRWTLLWRQSRVHCHRHIYILQELGNSASIVLCCISAFKLQRRSGCQNRQATYHVQHWSQWKPWYWQPSESSPPISQLPGSSDSSFSRDVPFRLPSLDFIPILPGRYKPHPTWIDTLEKREEALQIRHMKSGERWTEHTRRLPPLCVGDNVCIQNQTGSHTEVKQYNQYIVRMDGSGRAHYVTENSCTSLYLYRHHSNDDPYWKIYNSSQWSSIVNLKPICFLQNRRNYCPKWIPK